MSAGSRHVLFVVGLPLLQSCAASRAEPNPIGAACDASADCIVEGEAAGQCGFVRACIAGRCEAIDDAGTPASRIVSCASGRSEPR